MKKSFFIVLILAILSIPFTLICIYNIMQIKPEVYQPVTNLPLVEENKIEPEPEPLKEVDPTPIQPKSKPSAAFLSGYQDGWHGKWLGPVRWTLSDDYRQGHMLGSYDRKKGNDRYDLSK